MIANSRPGVLHYFVDYLTSRGLEVTDFRGTDFLNYVCTSDLTDVIASINDRKTAVYLIDTIHDIPRSLSLAQPLLSIIFQTFNRMHSNPDLT